MNALKINYSYYLFPVEFCSLDEFVEHINKNVYNFIKLTKLSERSNFPYFIEEDNKEVYIRFDFGSEIELVDVTFVKLDEYTQRLLKLVKEICINCDYYTDETETKGEIANLRGHWSQMNLDGFCDSFCKKTVT
ncbi:MAG: hypothetical protein FWD39_02380 [Clostridiales bacterium]|nr:hypothetical protein [Clostridiales bacterium]